MIAHWQRDSSNPQLCGLGDCRPSMVRVLLKKKDRDGTPMIKAAFYSGSTNCRTKYRTINRSDMREFPNPTIQHASLPLGGYKPTNSYPGGGHRDPLGLAISKGCHAWRLRTSIFMDAVSHTNRTGHGVTVRSTVNGRCRIGMTIFVKINRPAVSRLAANALSGI